MRHLLILLLETGAQALGIDSARKRLADLSLGATGSARLLITDTHVVALRKGKASRRRQHHLIGVVIVLTGLVRRLQIESGIHTISRQYRAAYQAGAPVHSPFACATVL